MSRIQPRLNPLTALVIGASGWILVLGLNSPAASLTVLAIALLAGTWRTRNPSLVAATALLAAPVAASSTVMPPEVMRRTNRSFPLGDAARRREVKK